MRSQEAWCFPTLRRHCIDRILRPVDIDVSLFCGDDFGSIGTWKRLPRAKVATSFPARLAQAGNVTCLAVGSYVPQSGRSQGACRFRTSGAWLDNAAGRPCYCNCLVRWPPKKGPKGVAATMASQQLIGRMQLQEPARVARLVDDAQPLAQQSVALVQCLTACECSARRGQRRLGQYQVARDPGDGDLPYQKYLIRLPSVDKSASALCA